MRNASTCSLAVVTLFLVAGAATSAVAQSHHRGWVGVDFGPATPADRQFTISANSARVCCEGVVTTRDLRSDVGLKTALAIGTDGGFSITRYLGIRGGFTVVSREGYATLSVQEANMWGSAGVFGAAVFVPTREFRRTEDSIEIGPVVEFPVAKRIQGRVFAGPSYFRIGQELMKDVDVTYVADEGYRPYWERPFTIPVRDVRYAVAQIHSSGWGYHAGAGVMVRVSRQVGVRATVRYGTARVELATNLDSLVAHGAVERVKAGGWSLLLGSSLHF